jgi:hypothetical protein
VTTELQTPLPETARPSGTDASASTARPGVNWGLWIQAGCVFCTLFFFAQPMVQKFHLPTNHVVDFHQEWLSARNFWTGHPIYAPIPESLRLHTGRIPNAAELVFHVNAHPPTAVLLALPVASASDERAFLIWNLLCLLGLLLSVAILIRELQLPVNGTLVTCLVCGFFLSEPIYIHFVLGQINLLLLPLLTVAWWADRRSWSLTAGGLIGVAAALKFFPAFLVVYFVGRRDWKAVAAVVAGFVGVNLVALGFLGVDAYRDYLTLGLPSAASFQGAFGNASLPALWIKLFAPTGNYGPSVGLWQLPVLAPILTVASIIAVAGIVWWMARSAASDFERQRAFAVGLVGMLWLSPVTWDHYFVLLLLPLAVVGLLSRNSIPRWVAFGASTALLWLTTIRIAAYAFPTAFVPASATLWDTLGIHSLQCYALGVLFLLVVSSRPRIDVGSPATGAA